MRPPCSTVVLSACCFYLTALAPLVAQADTLYVVNVDDSGPGSLRAALSSASDGDVIEITAEGTIRLESGELIVQRDVAILGPGAGTLSITADGRVASFTYLMQPSQSQT